MTDNQLKYQANKIAKERADEEKRANREKEKIEGYKLQESREDRASRERMNKYSTKAGLIGTVVGKTGDVVAKLAGKGNHAGWYNKDKAAVRDATGISFHLPVGSEFQKSSDPSYTGWSNAVTNGRETIPAIMTISWLPSIGGNGLSSSNANYSVINKAAQLLYDYIRNHNSGAKNYDYPDLLMLLMAAIEPRIFHAELVRLLKIMNTVDPQNEYLAKELVTILGFNYNDLKEHKAELRYYINQLGVQLAMFPIPKIFSVVERQVWMASNIFKESNNRRGQLIMYQRQDYFKYDWANGKLVQCAAQQWNNSAYNYQKTYNYIVNYGNDLFNAIATDSSLGNVVGDMIKAFSENGLYLSETSVDSEPVDFVYDPLILDQIDNTICIGQGGEVSTNIEIKQDAVTNNLLQGQSPTAGETYICVNPWGTLGSIADIGINGVGTVVPVVSMHGDDVSSDDLMVATRMLPGYVVHATTDSSGNTTYEARLAYSGTEIAVYCSVWYIDRSSGVNVLRSHTVQSFSTQFAVAGTAAANLASMVNFNKFNQFAHRPQLYLTTVDAAGNHTILDLVRQFDNYALVPVSTLANMHNAAIISEWGIPDLVMMNSK